MDRPRHAAVAMWSSAPTELQRGPFFVADARELGMTWDSLQTTMWRRMSRGQYAWRALPDDADLKLEAVAKRLTPPFAFSGRTAAWLLGLDMPPCDPIEVTIPRDHPARARAGLRLRRAELPEQDMTHYRGFPLTTPLRTVRDLGSRPDVVESVVAIDMALHAGIAKLDALNQYIDEHQGTKGVKRLRKAVSLADARSESPMETRLRVELVRAHLPRPSVQVNIHDRSGRFLARADLYYPDVRLVIEFDGQNHRDRLASDLRRQNELVECGYHILRFTAADVLSKGAAATHVRKTRNSLLHKLG